MKILSEILLDGENQYQAFFENTNDQEEIAKTLIAFSNSEGGVLLVGLKKNGKITGINPEFENECISHITKECCSPKIEYNSRVLQLEYRLLLEICVPPYNSKPVRFINNYKNEIYIRTKKSNLKANKIQENVWKYKNINGLRPNQLLNDDEVVLNFIISNPKSSLTKLHKNIEYPIDTVDYILVRLICWDIIQMELSEFGCEFSLIN